MSDARKTNRNRQPPAGTGQQDGTKGRTGKVPSDMLGDGAVDVSDPKTAADVTEIADQVHANA